MDRRQPSTISGQVDFQMQTQPAYAPQSVPRNLETTEPSPLPWFEDAQRNKPQSNSLGAAMFIFTSGGMSLAWSVGFSPSYTDMSASARTHMHMCWFLAVIIGACVSTLFIDKLEKRILNLWASSLVLINGILFVAAPGSIVAVVFARYLDGIAFGLTIIAAIVAGSEQAAKRFRGLVLSMEFLGITLGIMLRTTFMSIWDNNWELSNNRIHGICALLMGALAMLFTLLLTVESPVFILRLNNQNDEAAVNCIKRLLWQATNAEVYKTLNENKHLIAEDKERGRTENISRGLKPMIVLCLYRALVSMSFALPLNWGIVGAGDQLVVNNNGWWSAYIYGTMRMIGAFCAIFTLDTIGRKEPTASAMLPGGILLIGVGTIFTKTLQTPTDLHALKALLVVYQLLLGFAAPASTVFLGEAFSISVKPIFILGAVIFENSIQIIITCAFDYTDSSAAAYSFVLGILQIIFAFCLVTIMPETKQTTLREALELFHTRIHAVINRWRS